MLNTIILSEFGIACLFLSIIATMKKNILSLNTLVLTLLFAAASFCNAQNVKVKFGESNKGEYYNTDNFQPLGLVDGNYYYGYIDNLGKVFVEVVSENFKTLSTIKLEKLSPQSFSHLKIVGDKILLIYGDLNTSSKEYVIASKTYNLSGNMLEETKITEIAIKGSLANGVPKLYSEESEDGKQIAVCSLAAMNGGREANLTVITVSVNNLEVFKQQLVNVNYEDKKSLELTSLTVNNKADVFCIIQNWDGLNSAFYNSHLVKVEPSLNKEQVKAFENNGINFWNSTMKFNERNQSLNIAGLFVEKGAPKNAKYQGFFVANYDPKSLSANSIDSRGFDEDFFTFIDANYKKNRDKFEFYGYYIPEIILSESESTFVIFKHEQSGNLEDLMIFKLNGNGEIENRWLLPKYQTGSQGNGYFAYTQDEVLKIIYNDNEKNKDAKDMSEASASFKSVHKSTVVFLTEIDSKSSTINKKKLFNTDEKGGYFIPKKAMKIGEDVIFGIVDKKNVRFGKVTPKE